MASVLAFPPPPKLHRHRVPVTTVCQRWESHSLARFPGNEHETPKSSHLQPRITRTSSSTLPARSSLHLRQTIATARATSPEPPVPPDPPSELRPTSSLFESLLLLLRPSPNHRHTNSHLHHSASTSSSSPHVYVPGWPPDPFNHPAHPPPLETSHPVIPPEPPDPSSNFKSSSHLIDFFHIMANFCSSTHLHHLWLLLISSTSPLPLSRSDLHVSLITSEQCTRLYLLHHAATSIPFVLLRLSQLRPPATRARNGNRTLSNPTSATSANTKGLNVASSTLRLFSSALMAEDFAFKAAIDAGFSLEFQHLTVYSDPQSLVSPTNSDANELKNVHVDIYCLLETFSSISCFYVPCSTIVYVDAFRKLCCNFSTF